MAKTFVPLALKITPYGTPICYPSAIAHLLKLLASVIAGSTNTPSLLQATAQTQILRAPAGESTVVNLIPTASLAKALLIVPTVVLVGMVPVLARPTIPIRPVQVPTVLFPKLSLLLDFARIVLEMM